jgi:hemerythrin-like domain-containing protein
VIPITFPSFFPSISIPTKHRLTQHNHFRSTWTTLHTATQTNKRPPNTSIRAFIALGLSFVQSLTMHHNIEEAHVFPMLAAKMPRFREQEVMKAQHRAIHDGLDRFGRYLEGCQGGEWELRLGELGEIMDGFGDVLWQHLDQEIKELEAANMRRFWTVEEMRRMNF